MAMGPMDMQSLLGGAMTRSVNNRNGAADYVKPFFDALKLADIQRQRKEPMNAFGRFFGSLLGDGEDDDRPNPYAQPQQRRAKGVQLPSGQRRRQRQQLPNAGKQMIESLLGMSL